MRWKRWACAGLMAGGVGAAGCNRNAVQPPNPVVPVAQGEKPSLFESTFGQKSGFTPKPPPAEAIPIRDARKPNQPLKPDTEVALADNEVEAAFMEGRSAVERDQFLDSARQRYQRALAADPKGKAALLGLARLYTHAGEKEKAVATLEAATKHYPKDHELAHRLAGTHARFGDWAAAAEACKLALSLDPENRTYGKTLGYCQAMLGQWETAFGTLNGVMKEHEARYFIGRAMIDRGEVQMGRQQIAAAAQKEPDYHLARQFLTDLDTGHAPPQGEAVRTAGFEESATPPPAPGQ